MTNQELKDLLARFEGSSLSKLKLSTQEFTIEMERAVSAPAAPVLPRRLPQPPNRRAMPSPPPWWAPFTPPPPRSSPPL